MTIPRLPGSGSGSASPTRVQFPAGTFGTSLHDSVAAGGGKQYVLRAGAGHTMVVHIDAAADNATVTIKAPDGTVLSSGQTQPTVDLPENGDYIVQVVTTDGHAAEYQISFWIR